MSQLTFFHFIIQYKDKQLHWTRFLLRVLRCLNPRLLAARVYAAVHILILLYEYNVSALVRVPVPVLWTQSMTRQYQSFWRIQSTGYRGGLKGLSPASVKGT